MRSRRRKIMQALNKKTLHISKLDIASLIVNLYAVYINAKLGFPSDSFCSLFFRPKQDETIGTENSSKRAQSRGVSSSEKFKEASTMRRTY